MQRTPYRERAQPGRDPAGLATRQRGDGLFLAIDQAGGIVALARGLGLSQPSVSAWRRIPSDRVLAVEALTGIPREELRPDLYTGAKKSAHPPIRGVDCFPLGDVGSSVEIDELDQARARQYLLLAKLLTKAPPQILLDELAGLTGDQTPLGRSYAALAEAAAATDQERAGREFFNLFIGVGRGDVLPYASFYRTGFLNGRPLVLAREDLARLGLARSEQVFEPEDHLGTLFEVMAQLILGEVAEGQPDAAATFFKQHIESWGERAFEDIGLAPSATFYRAVAGTGQLWLEIETEALALPE
jgi:TorA maturation chaperone TorD